MGGGAAFAAASRAPLAARACLAAERLRPRGGEAAATARVQHLLRAAVQRGRGAALRRPKLRLLLPPGLHPVLVGAEPELPALPPTPACARAAGHADATGHRRAS